MTILRGVYRRGRAPVYSPEGYTVCSGKGYTTLRRKQNNSENGRISPRSHSPCQGGIPAGGDFRGGAGKAWKICARQRKYNRLPLDSAPPVQLCRAIGALLRLSPCLSSSVLASFSVYPFPERFVYPFPGLYRPRRAAP